MSKYTRINKSKLTVLEDLTFHKENKKVLTPKNNTSLILISSTKLSHGV